MEFGDKLKKVMAKLAKIIRRWGVLSCSGITTIMCLTLVIASTFMLKSSVSAPELYSIYIDAEDDALHTVDPRFLSLGLDSSVITDGFTNFNMTDPKLIKMMKYLKPAYLRIGGNQADQIIFCEEINNEQCLSKYENSIFNKSDTYTLSGSDWIKLFNLATMAGVEVIYDLNSLLRYENGSWNSENAEEMLQFSQDRELFANWELGNEPNSYEHKFNTTVNATQLGRDYITLKNILDKYHRYGSSFLIGPSTTRLRTRDIEEYFAEFLFTASKAVTSITWHHYYFSGVNATPEEFLDPHVFDSLEYHISKVNYIVRQFLEIPDKDIWLGETSSAWHAGAPGLSDRFIASFIWIDKLGLSARMGIDLVVRQSIFKGHYALLDDNYDPNPDWWLSVLYKKLVGFAVIKTYVNHTEGDEKIRLYAHCSREQQQENGDSIVVFGVNLNDKIGFVKIENLETDDNVQVYEFTSESSLYSKYVRLNGQTLHLLPNLDLPELKPKIIQREKLFLMPSYSIVFWVFTNTSVNACGRFLLKGI